jgi:hypothetical protein
MMKWFIVYIYVMHGQPTAVINEREGYDSLWACSRSIAAIKEQLRVTRPGSPDNVQMMCAGNDAVAVALFGDYHHQ